MIGLLCFVVAALASPFKSKIRLEAENATLRHQLVVLRRKLKGRARLTNNDRWFFVQLDRWFPSIYSIYNGFRTHRSKQRYAEFSAGSANRSHKFVRYLGRTSSPLWPD